VYIAALGAGTLERAFALAEELRDSIAGIRVEVNLGGGSFKSQMKRADKSGAEFALILGEQELIDACVGLKPMRSNNEQTRVALDKLAATLAEKLR
ncbi:MAG: histidine--tRNA ligase, partial [Planctomycetaceae bacterium]|nr:histidine--tRNA ligase [Planctomycetaceae bacterium]